MNEQETKQTDQRANWNIKPYLAVGLISFLVIIGSIAFFFLIFRYQEFTKILEKVMIILQPITIGLILAYFLNPFLYFEERHLLPFFQAKMNSQEKAKKVVRAISVAGALLFVVLVIGILLQMVIPELYKSINGMIGTLPKQVNGFMEWISDYVDNDSEISGYLEIGLTKGTEFFEHWAKTDFLPQTKNLVTGLTTGVIGVVKILFNVVVGIIISIYVLMSKEIFIGQSKKLVYALFPARSANAVIHTVHKSHEIFGGFISGKILDSLIIGILCFICLYLMNMPYSVLVSVIVGVTNVIPFFGPYLGAVPSTILIMLANPIQGLYFIIFILVLQQIDGNIIGPKILGDSTGLSSFWVVFAILVGGGFLGIPGMIIGVPLFAVIFYVIRNMLNYLIGKKQLPLDSQCYISAEKVDLDQNVLVTYQEEAKPSHKKDPGKTRRWRQNKVQKRKKK